VVTALLEYSFCQLSLESERQLDQTPEEVQAQSEQGRPKDESGGQVELKQDLSLEAKPVPAVSTCAGASAGDALSPGILFATGTTDD
jgi:hypothetical protein